METRSLTERMTPILDEINFHYYPLIDTRWLAKDKAEITIGDMHGNAIKLLHLLVKHGVLLMSKKDYDIVDRIYCKPVGELAAEDIATFSEIITNTDFNPDANDSLIRLIGDELSDRGRNDYFTLKIIQKLHRSHANFTILFSNHSFEFIRNYEKGREFEKGLMPDEFVLSMINLEILINEGLVSRDEVDEMIEQDYLPHLQAIDWSLDADEKLTIYTHAPSGWNFIRKFADDLNDFIKKLELDPEKIKMTPDWNVPIQFNIETSEDKLKTLIQIKKKFEFLKQNKLTRKMVSTKIIDEKNNIQDVEDSGLKSIIINRERDPEVLGRDDNDRWTNGHTDRSILTPQNVCDLDTLTGKYQEWCYYERFENDSRNKHTALFTNKEKKHHDGFYLESIEDIKKNILKLISEAEEFDSSLIAEAEDYEYYDFIFKTLLIIKENKDLWNKGNIENILHIKTSETARLVCQTLVEIREFSSVNQTDLDEVINADNNQLKTMRQAHYLRNLISKVSVDAAKEQIPEINEENQILYSNLDRLLRYCREKGFLNHESYRLIMAHLVAVAQFNNNQFDVFDVLKYYRQFIENFYYLLYTTRDLPSEVMEVLDILFADKPNGYGLDVSKKIKYFSDLPVQYLHFLKSLLNYSIEMKLPIPNDCIFNKNNLTATLLVYNALSLACPHKTDFLKKYKKVYLDTNHMAILNFLYYVLQQEMDANTFLNKLQFATMLNAQKKLSAHLISFIENTNDKGGVDFVCFLADNELYDLLSDRNLTLIEEANLNLNDLMNKINEDDSLCDESALFKYCENIVKPVIIENIINYIKDYFSFDDNAYNYFLNLYLSWDRKDLLDFACLLDYSSARSPITLDNTSQEFNKHYNIQRNISIFNIVISQKKYMNLAIKLFKFIDTESYHLDEMFPAVFSNSKLLLKLDWFSMVYKENLDYNIIKNDLDFGLMLIDNDLLDTKSIFRLQNHLKKYPVIETIKELSSNNMLNNHTIKLLLGNPSLGIDEIRQALSKPDNRRKSNEFLRDNQPDSAQAKPQSKDDAKHPTKPFQNKS